MTQQNNELKILFLGDICGKPARKVLKDNLATIKKEKNIDLCIANIENIAHGRGATQKTYEEVAAAGVDAFTGGNHIFRYEEIYEYLDDESKHIVRPANYPDDVVGKGHMVLDLGKNGRVLMISLIGKAFFNENTSDPFRKVDEILEMYKEEDFAAIVVDYHTEATAETVSMGFYLDGKVSSVVGTHTHVPTADERVLPKGTAYITDVGMVGPMDSSLWLKTDVAIKFQKYPYPAFFEIEDKGPVRLDAVIIEIFSKSKAKSIQRLNRVFEK